MTDPKQVATALGAEIVSADESPIQATRDRNRVGGASEAEAAAMADFRRGLTGQFGTKHCCELIADVLPVSANRESGPIEVAFD